jgi:thymidylate synthase
MGERSFSAATLDDVMRDAIEAIQRDGDHVNATKGPNAELRGVRLEITNPRARLSRTETRGKPFSALGELCWYLAGTNSTDFIRYYIDRYKEWDEGGIIFGGYGPRLLRSDAGNQIVNVTKLLQERPDSRRAVIQLFEATDIVEDRKDVPCTCVLQPLLRDGALHMVVYMRSNDVIWGLPHDVFCFTMLQEIIAASLGAKLGTYTHIAGSLHLYDDKLKDAENFVGEGWQPTKIEMPAMPTGDPWPAIATLVELEEKIRAGADPFLNDALDHLDVYWVDIIRLLQIFKCLKMKDFDTLAELRKSVDSAAYHLYIDSKFPKA